MNFVERVFFTTTSISVSALTVTVSRLRLQWRNNAAPKYCRRFKLFYLIYVKNGKPFTGRIKVWNQKRIHWIAKIASWKNTSEWYFRTQKIVSLLFRRMGVKFYCLQCHLPHRVDDFFLATFWGRWAYFLFRIFHFLEFFKQHSFLVRNQPEPPSEISLYFLSHYLQNITFNSESCSFNA